MLPMKSGVSKALSHFWATRCPLCRYEMPAMERAHKKVQNEQIVRLALNRCGRKRGHGPCNLHPAAEYRRLGHPPIHGDWLADDLCDRPVRIVTHRAVAVWQSKDLDSRLIHGSRVVRFDKGVAFRLDVVIVLVYQDRFAPLDEDTNFDTMMRCKAIRGHCRSQSSPCLWYLTVRASTDLGAKIFPITWSTHGLFSYFS